MLKPRVYTGCSVAVSLRFAGHEIRMRENVEQQI
jgi:hypothetical protein